jgi:large subunit ribosomal protein L1
VHSVVGKQSFEKQKLVENINAMIGHLRRVKPATSKGAYFRKAIIKGSMTPAVVLDVH